MAKKLPEKGTPDWHQLQVAKKTLMMNPVMAKTMGGMSIEEAKKLTDEYGVKVMRRGGTVVGESHANGGVPFELKDTGTHIEEEGNEINIPREIGESDEEHEFEGTNYEILNKILKLGDLSLKDEVTEVKSGDIVICIKSAWDDVHRKYKGTVRQVLSAINESCGCKHIESGAVMKNLETGVQKKMTNGGQAGDEETREDKWRNTKNAEGENIIEKILFVLHNNPFYVEHKKFPNIHLAPIISMVMDEYLIYDKNNPIITKFGEMIYFEPHKEHFRRKGLEIPKIEYATHFVTGYTYPNGIRKRVWDKSKYDAIQFLIPVLKSDGVQRLYQKADIILKRQEAIVYAEEIPTKKGLCVILITEINENGSVRAISFLPKEKRGYIEKQKASGVWSDASVFSPTNEKPPFGSGRTCAAGGSVISNSSYNKGSKISDSRAYSVTFFNIDLQPVIDAEINGGIKTGNKSISLEELLNLYQKRTESDSYSIGGQTTTNKSNTMKEFFNYYAAHGAVITGGSFFNNNAIMATGGNAGKKKSAPKKKKDQTWEEIALDELRAQEGDEDIKVGNSDIGNGGFKAESGNSSWIVFENVDDAEAQAIERVTEDLENEPELFSPDWIKNHYYVSDTDRRIMANEEADRIVEDENIEDEDEKEKRHDEIYNEWYDGLEDPIDFLVENQGIYSVEDLLKASFMRIDVDKAAKEAVNEDGVAHFLSHYDGEQIDLPSGAVAYRTN